MDHAVGFRENTLEGKKTRKGKKNKKRVDLLFIWRFFEVREHRGLISEYEVRRANELKSEIMKSSSYWSEGHVLYCTVLYGTQPTDLQLYI